jgi:hypothetical protein
MTIEEAEEKGFRRAYKWHTTSQNILFQTF